MDVVVNHRKVVKVSSKVFFKSIRKTPINELNLCCQAKLSIQYNLLFKVKTQEAGCKERNVNVIQNNKNWEEYIIIIRHICIHGGVASILMQKKNIFTSFSVVALDEVFAGNVFSSYAAELLRMDLALWINIPLVTVQTKIINHTI